MNKHASFVAIVQTRAIVETLSRTTMRPAHKIVARATEISEEAIPHDYATAAEQFLDYALARGGYSEPPDWYAEWRDTLVMRPSW